jgi:hypothetical protein
VTTASATRDRALQLAAAAASADTAARRSALTSLAQAALAVADTADPEDARAIRVALDRLLALPPDDPGWGTALDVLGRDLAAA